MTLSLVSVSSLVSFPIIENSASLRDRNLIASRDILEIDLSQPGFSLIASYIYVKLHNQTDICSY